MRVGLVHDSCFLDHQTGHHPERPERLQSIERALEANHLYHELPRLPFKAACLEDVRKVHHPGMVDRVMRISEHGGGLLDADTVISAASGRVALCAVGAGQAAVRALVEDRFDHVMCLVRPPGHHATPSRSMGFCLFNNVAIAAETLLADPQITRVGIVDFDVHHGNGTQDVFYERGDVFFFSIHQYPHYPGTGAAHENGSGEGEGKNLNIPLPGGVSKGLWFDHFKHGLDAISAFEPDAILVSAGFDGHRLDPLGHFPLDEDGYFKIGAKISELAGHGHRRVLSFLEGGYNLEVLGRSVASYLHGFC